MVQPDRGCAGCNSGGPGQPLPDRRDRHCKPAGDGDVLDRKTGDPVGPAIVWQDRRTAEICRRLSAGGLEKTVVERTGLLLDPISSSTKIMWFLESERRRFGPGPWAETSASARWTRGSSASSPGGTSRIRRTPHGQCSFDIHKGEWDPETRLGNGRPAAMLPRVCPSSSDFGVAPSSLLGRGDPGARRAG